MKQTILITGVGKRLGLAMAQHFLSQGLHVIGTYRTERESLITLTEQGAELIQCDLLERAQVEDLCTNIQAMPHSLRAIIHNASDWASEKDMSDAWQDFEALMTIHAKAPFFINERLHTQLSEQADIIHITDYVAATGSDKHMAYAASKAAMENLTLSFSKKYAPACQVNSIAPALMLFNDEDSDAYKQKALAKSLLQREGGIDEFIQSVEFLLQSQYMTGRVIHLDGGRHLK